MYNANHSDLPASSLLDALKFLFNEYRNFNDFKTYSKKPDFEIEEYLKRYEEKVKNLYDINTQILEDDYFYLFLETLKDWDIDRFSKLVKFDDEKNNFEYLPILLLHYRKDLADYDKAKRIAHQILQSDD